MSPSSHANPRLDGWRFGEGAAAPSPWYRAMRRFFQVTMCAAWKVRVFNRHHEPARGGVVYICNHQSFLDPMLMSFALRRPMNYMARESLFRVPVFKRLIESLNAFPVRRESADLGAMKEALRRIRAGGQLVMFAEGTRTRDGTIGRMLPGVAMLSRRAAEWTVPVLIDGAFEAWPRWRMFPAPGNVVVQYARPISRAEARRLEPDAFVARVRNTLIDMQHEVRRRIGRPALKYKTPGE